jgi:hypothetical protein
MTTATVWDMLEGRSYRWSTFNVSGPRRWDRKSHCRIEWRRPVVVLDPDEEPAPIMNETEAAA